jgi:hypothetical protein
MAKRKKRRRRKARQLRSGGRRKKYPSTPKTSDEEETQELKPEKTIEPVELSLMREEEVIIHECDLQPEEELPYKQRPSGRSWLLSFLIS